jgi:Pyridoxamine 5'-phosphate oxidase
MPFDDHRTPLGPAECLRLVGSVPFGRVVYSSAALPAVRVARHLADGSQIVLCASLGEAVSPAAGGAGPVMAYEADLIDAGQLTGWSVVIVGRASVVTDEARAERYRAALGAAEADEAGSQVITITAELVTGYRLAGRAGAHAPGASYSS